MIASLFLALVSPQAELTRFEAPAREPAALEFAPGTELRVHEVGHLTGQARLAAHLAELTAAASRLAPPEAVAGFERLAALRAEVESSSRGLLETVRDLLAPALGPGQRLELLDGARLALLGLPEQHACLAGFLVQAAAFDGLVDVQARIYETEAGTLPLAFAGRSGKTLEAGQELVLLRHLSAVQAESILAPRVSVFPFQEAHLKAVDEVAYVKDYEIKVLPEQEVADPIIDVAQNGVNLHLRALPVGGDGLVLYVRLEHSKLVLPIRSVEVELAMGVPVTIQLPDVTHVGLQGRFELGPGQCLLLTTPVDSGGERVMLLLLQARRVPAERSPKER